MKMKSGLLVFLNLAISVNVMFLAACSQSQPPSTAAGGNSDQTAAGIVSTVDQPPAPESNVELDVFSGVPNPTWKLSESEAASLAQLLTHLEATQSPGQRFDGLGYRGFIVHLVAPQSLAISTMHAYGGTVEIESGDGTSFYQDPQRQVERWLLETGRPYFSDELYKEISNEIQ